MSQRVVGFVIDSLLADEDRLIARVRAGLIHSAHDRNSGLPIP
jgi:hypothetical protein